MQDENNEAEERTPSGSSSNILPLEAYEETEEKQQTYNPSGLRVVLCRRFLYGECGRQANRFGCHWGRHCRTEQEFLEEKTRVPFAPMGNMRGVFGETGMGFVSTQQANPTVRGAARWTVAPLAQRSWQRRPCLRRSFYNLVLMNKIRMVVVGVPSGGMRLLTIGPWAHFGQNHGPMGR